MLTPGHRFESCLFAAMENTGIHASNGHGDRSPIASRRFEACFSGCVPVEVELQQLGLPRLVMAARPLRFPLDACFHPRIRCNAANLIIFSPLREVMEKCC